MNILHKNPIFFACTENDKVTQITEVIKKVWLYYSKIGIVLSINFPTITKNTKNLWFDENHAKGPIIGNYIIGPLVLDIYNILNKNNNLQTINIAILGDSTVAYCSQHSIKYFKKKYTCLLTKKKKKIPENGAFSRHDGVSAYLNDIFNKINLNYYCVSGKSLNTYKGGFLQQLGCCMHDHYNNVQYDAILMVGGWNNYELRTNDCEIFTKMLNGDKETINYWSDLKWRKEMVDTYFPEGTIYPLLY